MKIWSKQVLAINGCVAKKVKDFIKVRSTTKDEAGNKPFFIQPFS